VDAAEVVTFLDQFSAGCLFGAQLVWTLCVIPTFRLLKPTEYLKMHTLLTWYGDMLMPILGLSTCTLGFIRYNLTGEWSALVSALALTLASIAASRNLAINKKMRDVRSASGDQTLEALADDLVRNRKMWATQHFIRHFGGFVAFVTALIVPESEMTFGRDNFGPFGFTDILMVIVFVMVGKEIVQHIVMMRRRGRFAGMSQALGIE
jgi:hypothetical protein